MASLLRSQPVVVFGPAVYTLSVDYGAVRLREMARSCFFLPAFGLFSPGLSVSPGPLVVAPVFCFCFQAAQSPSAHSLPFEEAFAAAPARPAPLPERVFASAPLAVLSPHPLVLPRCLGLCLEVADGRVTYLTMYGIE